ncbi:XRE family transcriptional regulator [Neokomagataea thailandica NBRC 106555]|uniref:Helix-turn-helix domain-containing protein n=2 Tax=Neokomagataea TaxID=1223423 RepID=A0A4Y6VAL3_9PROT|nr:MULTISPECIES: helix-turn-helix domain-containing protein [Neokomagataea]QDH25507.1 helix-turn-helix domain-containing protein [Neokomagataea tanensis]GBR55064.1 XRE family transcriptional regulator [Neokomagataea thailandica NBRC 106555]
MLHNKNSENTSEIDHAVGYLIREHRKQNGLQLRNVASRVGISVSHLSQIERGATSPSVRDLMKIAEVLELDVSNFFQSFQGQASDIAKFYTRKESHKKITFNDGITKVCLNSQKPELLRTYLMIIQPNGHSGDKHLSHAGFEAGFIIEGTLHLQVNSQYCVLNEGDSFSFLSHLPHKYENRTNVITKVMWSNTL